MVHCQIYAVYERNRKILAFMVLIFFTGGVSQILAIAFYMPVGEIMRYLSFDVEINPEVGVTLRSSGLTGCWTTRTPTLMFVIGIPPLVLEIILCLFILYKAWRTYKDDWKSPLLNVIIRDRCVTHHPSRSTLMQ
jgi:hypothetical protein